MKRVMILLLVCILFINSVNAVAISPAKVDGRFEPGLETELAFSVQTKLDRELELYIEGDLAEYMELDKQKLYKSGSFKVMVNLPEEIDPPGPTRTIVGAREIVNFDKEIRGAIATATEIQASIYIFIPYPGKYVESGVKAHDVNLGEPVTFDLDITSRGKEPVIINPRIEIYSETNELMDSLIFQQRELNKDQGVELTKTLDTTGYNSGNYIAKSIVDYDGKFSEHNTSFRIGELSIDVINYTKRIEINGIKPFRLTLESGWNDIIEGAYADVRISNDTNQIASFTTTPTSLEPWQTKLIKGYFNSSEATNGTYNVFMSVYYFGAGKNKTAVASGKVEFIYPEKGFTFDYSFVLSILFGIILFILLVIWIFKKIFLVKIKNVKRKK